MKKRILCLVMVLAIFVLAGCNSKKEPVSGSGPVDALIQTDPGEKSESGGGKQEQEQAPAAKALEIFDLAEVSGDADDMSGWNVRFELPSEYNAGVYNSSIAAMYVDSSNMSEDEYAAYKRSIADAYESLDYHRDGCQPEWYLNLDECEISTMMFDEQFSTGWNGWRYIDDEMIGMASQNVSLYCPQSREYVRVDVKWMHAFVDGENIADSELVYQSEFFSNVLGREIDPVVMASVWNYGLNHMIMTDDDDPMLGRNISVVLGDPDIDENLVMLEFSAYKDLDDGEVHTDMSATVFIDVI